MNNYPGDINKVPREPVEEPPAYPIGLEGDHDGYAQLLEQALTESGVQIGAFDKRLIEHLGRFVDWEMAATMTSWILRSHTAGVALAIAPRKDDR